jgi:hypothetical protein
VVGEGGFTLRLTTSEAVASYLPDGSTPLPLTQDYVDPPKPQQGQKSMISVLAGQVTTLSLNVIFDSCDPNFSPSTLSLRDQVYCNTGPCNGLTVWEILDVGNQALGGGTIPSGFTYSSINDCVASINENYDNGNGNDQHNLCSPGCST